MKRIGCLLVLLLVLVGCTPAKPSPAKTLIVGLDDTFAPMGFRDDNNQLVGFDVDLANEVGKRLEYTITFQPIDWSLKENELNNKNIDLIWNGYTITESRKEKVLFSMPYLKNRQIIIVLEDSPIIDKAGLAGKTVSVQKDSSSYEAVNGASDVVNGLKELVTLDTNLDVFMDLETGRADAIVCDEVLARYVMKARGEDKYTVLSDNFGEEEYGIGMRKADVELQTKINDTLSAMIQDGTFEAIYQKWFAK